MNSTGSQGLGGVRPSSPAARGPPTSVAFSVLFSPPPPSDGFQQPHLSGSVTNKQINN